MAEMLRPLNLTKLERQTLLVALKAMLDYESGADENWMSTTKAGRVVLNHLVEKLKGKSEVKNDKD